MLKIIDIRTPLFICGTILNYFGLSLYKTRSHVTADPTYSGAFGRGPIPPFSSAGTAGLENSLFSIKLTINTGEKKARMGRYDLSILVHIHLIGKKS